MKVGKIWLTADSKTMTLHLDFDGSLWREVHELFRSLEGAEEVEIKKKRKKRSLDQNSYMWELIGQIAERLRIGSNDVYRNILRDYGVFEILPVKSQNIARWADVWGAQGIGWITEDLGECKKLEGYHNIKTYYGTSCYDSKEMSRVIDGVVQEAKELGIETLTPNELKRLEEIHE